MNPGPTSVAPTPKLTPELAPITPTPEPTRYIKGMDPNAHLYDNQPDNKLKYVYDYRGGMHAVQDASTKAIVVRNNPTSHRQALERNSATTITNELTSEPIPVASTSKPTLESTPVASTPEPTLEIDNSSAVKNIDNSTKNVVNSVTIVNATDDSASNTDNSINEFANNIDNSINTVDTSIDIDNESIVNAYNAFTIDCSPVDLSGLIQGEGKAANLVKGTKEDDIISFGKGRDTLRGGKGDDIFVFNKKDKFGKKGADKIVDFNAEDDQLLVGKKALRGLGKKPEFGTASNRKELNALAKDDMNLVYFEPKGFLYYNYNDEGKGFGKKGGLFAILQDTPEMTEDNIGLMG